MNSPPIVSFFVSPNSTRFCYLNIETTHRTFSFQPFEFFFNMEKRCRPPQGFYKSLDSIAISRASIMCDKKPDVLGVYQAERIVAKKFRNGKPLFMVKWLGYCASENTWEPKAHCERSRIQICRFAANENSCKLKIPPPPPPITFLMVRPLFY